MKTRTLIAMLGISVVLAACGQPTTTATTTTTMAETTTTTTAETTTTTTAETTTTAGDPGVIVPGEDPDVDAIVELYKVVFDSTTSFEEKAALIDDPAGLESTVATYAANGAAVGGVSAEVTAVDVDGDVADVVYTLKFSGNPTYAGLTGSAVREAGTWKVSREMFCGVMASARSTCPAS